MRWIAHALRHRAQGPVEEEDDATFQWASERGRELLEECTGTRFDLKPYRLRYATRMRPLSPRLTGVYTLRIKRIRSRARAFDPVFVGATRALASLPGAFPPHWVWATVQGALTDQLLRERGDARLTEAVNASYVRVVRQVNVAPAVRSRSRLLLWSRGWGTYFWLFGSILSQRVGVVAIHAMLTQPNPRDWLEVLDGETRAVAERVWLSKLSESV